MPLKLPLNRLEKEDELGDLTLPVLASRDLKLLLEVELGEFNDLTNEVFLDFLRI